MALLRPPAPQTQLVAIVEGTHRSEFSYDGLHRRVRIRELEDGVPVHDERLVWAGDAILERRDGQGSTVTARFFQGGIQDGGTQRYLARDYLQTVVVVTDQQGAVVARREYGPYGDETTIAGASVGGPGFTGVLAHEPTGLMVMQYRLYDSAIGRWLSEDPLGLDEGPNLYAYVRNNPLRWIDPTGTTAVIAQLPTNGNMFGGGGLQDYKCSAPFGALNYDPCTKRCCVQHDQCYKKNECNMSSWLRLLSTKDCARCNQIAVGCVVTAKATGCGIFMCIRQWLYE